MPLRPIELRAGYYYHLYNRGVNYQPIFFTPANWLFFIKQLRQYGQPESVSMIAYCLMPNHYHFLVYVKADDFSQKVMQPFGVSYTKAINKQEKRVGSLFQGPFKVKLVDTDEYLLHLSRYIHLNPVFAKLVDHPAKWKFSSYQDYIGLRSGTWPEPGVVLAQLVPEVNTVKMGLSEELHKLRQQAYARFVETYTDNDRKVIEHLMLD